MGVDKVDMSLDDIIASSKRGRGGRGRGRSGRGRGGLSSRRIGGSAAAGGGGGPVRRGGNRGGSFRGNRNTPYNRPKNIPDKWEHDMFDGTGSKGRRMEGLSTGTHLQISNLDFGVTESDIKELFSEFGKLKKANINYDGSGRSHGTADVLFERKADALKAYNTYNGVPLDGRPMRIETVAPTIAAATSTSFSGRRDSGMNSNRSRGRNNFGSNRGSNRGGNRGGTQGGRGRGRGGGRRSIPSKDDLDKELDSYIESNNS